MFPGGRLALDVSSIDDASLRGREGGTTCQLGVEFGQPRLTSIVEDKNGVDHGSCSLCRCVVCPVAELRLAGR